MSLQEIIIILLNISGGIFSEVWYLITYTKYLVQWIWLEPFLQVVLPSFAFPIIWISLQHFFYKIRGLPSFFEEVDEETTEKMDGDFIGTVFWIITFIILLLSYDYFNLSFYYYDLNSDDILNTIRLAPIIRLLI